MSNSQDPYGVPTGSVPRREGAKFVQHIPATDERTRIAAGADGRVVVAHPDHPPVVIDPIAQAVDDYLLMERKARAWDELRDFYDVIGQVGLVAHMDTLVHPAQNTSSR